MEELVRKLRPYVSTFSAKVAEDYKNGDDITVGGVVTGILNLAELLQDSQDEDFQKEGVYVTLDDGVGKNEIVIPHGLFLVLEQKGTLNMGQPLIATGRVLKLDTTHTYKDKRSGKSITVDKHKHETTRVLAWELAPLPEDEEKRVPQEHE